MTRSRWMAPVAACLLAACGGRQPEPAATPSPEARYATLPDTLVCVVDRTTQRGLRELAAKRSLEGEVILMVGGEVKPLAELHPVGLVAGYAGQEPWFTANERITVHGQRYAKAQGERRIPMESLQQNGEFRAIPMFSDPRDTTPPRALYAPVRPGCIFQAYVREQARTNR